MSHPIVLKPDLRFGIVPAHLRFVGCLVPEEGGKLPRDADGALRVVAGVEDFCRLSRVAINCVQIPLFPGTDPADLTEAVSGLRALGLEVCFVIMVGGVNPMDPADEDAVVAQLVPSLRAAITHGVAHISSTSIEEWMGQAPAARGGEAFDQAVAQNIKVHLRVYEEAGIAGSCIENWHIEFLRPGEFKTFTTLERGWAFIHAANQALGKTFFKALVDASHCGDSGVSIEENQELIARIGAARELGIFHASPKTTRGCLSTDDGWIGALLAAMARAGGLRHVFVEVFDHEDPGLAPLRAVDPGHGVDTRDGRTYAEVVVDGVAEVAHRLNNLAARGILKS